MSDTFYMLAKQNTLLLSELTRSHRGCSRYRTWDWMDRGGADIKQLAQHKGWAYLSFTVTLHPRHPATMF